MFIKQKDIVNVTLDLVQGVYMCPYKVETVIMYLSDLTYRRNRDFRSGSQFYTT